MKRLYVKSFTALFVLLYVISCKNEPIMEKPEVVVPPTIEEEKPSDPTVNDDKPYIKAGTSELVEIRNDNDPYFTDVEYLKAADGYFMELSPFDVLGIVVSYWWCFYYSHISTEDRTSLSTFPSGFVHKIY